MGYRSEVVLAVAPELAGAFLSLFAKNKEVEDLCRSADKFESGYREDGDWLMHWDHIKWYPSFPEIADIIDFIDAVESDDMSDYGLGDPPPGKRMDGTEYEANWCEYFRFVRIGEDMDDIDEHGYYCHGDIHVDRSISF